MDYPIEHFWAYTNIVWQELADRGYRIEYDKFGQWFEGIETIPECLTLTRDDIFSDWHDDRYYWQCYHNLEEKYDCGGIDEQEWQELCDEVCSRL